MATRYLWTLAIAALVLAAGAIVLLSAYGVAARRHSRRLAARCDEQLAERSRDARELHDRLLQTIHGSKLVVDHALRDAADHPQVVRALERVSEWLGQASDEGQAALQSLPSSADADDLAAALRRAIEECRSHGGADMPFSVRGAPRAMRAALRDEVYRIGYEAIRNACVHARARRIAVSLDYGRDLTLRVEDDGVGIDAGGPVNGRAEHVGLRDMFDRAERLGAVLAVHGGPGRGTTVSLRVPGRIAYRRD